MTENKVVGTARESSLMYQLYLVRESKSGRGPNGWNTDFDATAVALGTKISTRRIERMQREYLIETPFSVFFVNAAFRH